MMKNMSLSNIAKVCHGTYHGDEALLVREVEGISIDSRQIEKDWLFVATKGEKVDGHSFIPQVAEKQALCVLSEKELEKEDWYQGQIPYILVEDSFQAIKELAAFYLEQLSVKVVGITGSVGKTSTKEMVAGVLSEKYNVLKTAGNFNNEVGLPLTVFRLRDEHEIAVLEMGISDFGEMHRLSKIAKPDIAVITNIGQCHLENLGDRNGVLKAKTEVFDEMNPEGEVVLNGDDDKLATITEVHGKCPYFFHKVECDAWLPEEQGCQKPEYMIYADCIESLGLKGTKCRIHAGDDVFKAHIKVPGEHQVNNALAASAVGKLLGLTADEIGAGIEKVVPISGRTNIIETEQYVLVDDCYNANPMSMKAALELLETALTRKVAVLGDMFELGENSDSLHYSVGSFAGKKDVDVLCIIGENAKHIYDGAKAEGNPLQKIYHFDTKQAFLDDVQNILKKGDTVLLKASHGMGFAELVEKLSR